jgi:YVTN family beta-propeller protein
LESIAEPGGICISSAAYEQVRGKVGVEFAAATNAVTATIQVGSGADFVTFNPDGSRAYVTHFGGNSVAVIDTTGNTVVANITVGSYIGRLVQ